MTPIFSSLKTFATLVKLSAMNSVIEFTTKSHYGGPELVYVTSEHKEPLQVLTKSKTLSTRDVKALKDLGFSFKENGKTEKIL